MPLLFHMVSEALPRLVSPLLQSAPEAVAANLANIDLFDGFGNAGMAQPPPGQMGFALEEEQHQQQQQFPMSGAEYERKYTPESSGSGGSRNGGSLQGHPTPPDMGTSFTTSPPMMSPGVEFQGGMGDFAGFPDVMMGRMPMQAGPPGMGQQQQQQQQQHHVHHGAGQQQQQPAAGLGVSPQGMGPSPGMGGGQGMMVPPGQKGMGGQVAMHGMGGGGMAQLQRSGSFVTQGVRTVGDFHAMQRVSPVFSPFLFFPPTGKTRGC